MTEFWLVRHGQTDWNLARRYQGQTDIPLNATGIEQAKELAKSLANEKFDAVYSSDLSRAAVTAQILAKTLGMNVLTDKRLREIKKGIWEGLSFDEVQRQYAADLSKDSVNPVHSRTPGGETVAEVAMRMKQAADEIALRHPGGKVLLVSHGLAVSTLYCQANHWSLKETYQHIPDNAIPLKITWEPNHHNKNQF